MEIRIKPLSTSTFVISLLKEDGTILKFKSGIDIHELNKIHKTYSEILSNS